MNAASGGAIIRSQPLEKVLVIRSDPSAKPAVREPRTAVGGPTGAICDAPLWTENTAAEAHATWVGRLGNSGKSEAFALARRSSRL
jgi:hypothetical protein